MAALVTTLYTQHNKAKVKATEVATALASVIGRTVPIEFEWKFVDQPGFKTIPTETQKSILVNTLGHNLTQCLLGLQDSLAAALAASAPLRDLFASIIKIVFSYDYASTIVSTIGAAHLNIFVGGKNLVFKSNLNAIQVLNNGDWGVSSKLLALASGTPTVPSVVAIPVIQSIPIMTTPVVLPETSNVVISPPSVSAPVAAASTPAAASAKIARVGGPSGGNGLMSFLYVSTEKAKKRKGEIGKELSTRLGTEIGFEVDLNSLVKSPAFTKESEADQKAFLNAAPDSWAGALYAALNGSSTVEAALRAQPGMTKVKWVYVPSCQPTPGWSFLEVSGSGTDLLIHCAIASADEIYGVSVDGAPLAPAAAAVPTKQSFVPVPAPVSVVVSQPPVVIQPVAAPIVVVPVATPVAAPPPVTVASPIVVAPSGPAPGSRLVHVGGKPGGNGTASFLYNPIDKLKRWVSDTCTKEFSTLMGSSRTSLVIDTTFAKNPAFTQLSDADQRGCVLGPVTEQLACLTFKMANGDHLASVFKNPEFADRCVKIVKVTFLYKSDISSGAGYPGWSLEWSENGTEIIIRIDIGSVDMFPDDSWGVTPKAIAGIAALEQQKEEAARAAEQREVMAALEKKAAVELKEEEKRMLEQKAAAAKLAEQERVRQALLSRDSERVAILEDFGVTPRLREENERLNKCLASFKLSGTVQYEVDNLFIHDKKLRWCDCGTQKTVLKSISMETWSIFRVITEAAIMVALSGKVGRNHFIESYAKFSLSFELSDPAVKVPRLVLDPETKTVHIFCSFANMYAPRKWFDDLMTGMPLNHIYEGTTIEELFKAKFANDAGWLEAMARDEATTTINRMIAPYFATHFECREIPIEVDWESLDRLNEKSPAIVRMKKHYEIAPLVLDIVFQSFKEANLVVMTILRAKLQQIRVVASTSDSAVLQDKGALLIICYDWNRPRFGPSRYKMEIEQRVRDTCDGLKVKNLSAEISMQDAAPQLLELNRTLHDKAGMVSAKGDDDILVVDYPSFVDTPEFIDKYHKTNYYALWRENTEALKSLVNGFVAVSKTNLGGPLLKTVKRIHIGFDVNSDNESEDAPLHWDPATGTFTVTYSFSSFSHPVEYNYIPRIEYELDILIEACRNETREQMEQFYSTVKSDFGLSSLPVIVDESYQQTAAFKRIHPSLMKPIVMRFFTSLPPSIFHGAMGLKHISEFPKARQHMHDKIKKIRILPDGRLASGKHELELTDGELVLRLAFDMKDWTKPIGYQLSDLIGARPIIESEVIAEVDAGLVSFTNLLREHVSNPKISVKFNWDELLKDGIFQSSQNYVNGFVRFMLQRVKRTFEGSGRKLAIYDAGLIHYLQKTKKKEEEESASLAEIMSLEIDTLEYHVDTANTVSTKGQFGRYTPYRYRVTKSGRTLHIHFNLADYPVGIGSIVEWVCDPDGAHERESRWVTKICQIMYQEVLKHRENHVKNVYYHNQSLTESYRSDIQDFNAGRRHTIPLPPELEPKPIFKPIKPGDFVSCQDRTELRHQHWMEDENKFFGDDSDSEY